MDRSDGWGRGMMRIQNTHSRILIPSRNKSRRSLRRERCPSGRAIGWLVLLEVWSL